MEKPKPVYLDTGQIDENYECVKKVKKVRKNKYLTIKHMDYTMYNGGVHKLLSQPKFKKYTPILNFMIGCLEFKTNMCIYKNRPLTTNDLCVVFNRKNVREMRRNIKFLKDNNLVKKHRGRFFINPFKIAKGQTFLTSTIKLFKKGCE